MTRMCKACEERPATPRGQLCGPCRRRMRDRSRAVRELVAEARSQAGKETAVLGIPGLLHAADRRGHEKHLDLVERNRNAGRAGGEERATTAAAAIEKVRREAQRYRSHTPHGSTREMARFLAGKLTMKVGTVREYLRRLGLK